MYVLGFDYGHQKIGVAIGQRITQTASPLVTIQRKDGPPWSTIEELVQEWRPDIIVVGLPLTAEGQEQPVTLAARQFAKTLENKLAQKYNLALHFHDERYTSQAASSLYTQPAKKTRQQAWGRDAVAACLILEGWFSENNATK